jgi:hypothetical protein
MSHPKRARLDLTRLDDRLVPSTVNATTTARPFDFVATGTMTTTTASVSGTVPVTSTANTSVTLRGELNYDSNTVGSAGLVSISGTGTGNEVPTNPANSGGRGSFAQTVQGQLAIADADGIISTPTPLTGTVNWLTPTNGAGIDLIGPQAATGTFDTATFKMQAGWSTPGASTGNIAVTLADKTNAATDLAFGDQAAALASDGSLSLDFSVNVIGAMMHAASHDAAATDITAVWEGNGQSQATDIDIPIYWNTGNVAVHVTGLTPPSWATQLVVRIDGANTIAEGDETNNAWTVTMSDLVPPPPPPLPPPLVPPPPPPVAASYALMQEGGEEIVEFRSATGVIIGQVPAISGFSGPVAMAVGDVNGDGVPDVALAAGNGGAPRVRVLDGKTGLELTNFFAYESTFRSGVNIALGDLDGDGRMELITGAAAGGGPRVRVIDPTNGNGITGFFAYDSDGRGGVSVAAADLNSDGKDEIITTPGAGEGQSLFIFDGTTGDVLFDANATDPQAAGGTTVNASRDPITHAIVVTVTPDDGGPIVKFRSQLAAGDPILTPVPTSMEIVTPVAVP